MPQTPGRIYKVDPLKGSQKLPNGNVNVTLITPPPSDLVLGFGLMEGGGSQ